MTALPNVPAIGPAVTNNDVHAFLTDQRAFLAGLFGTAGTVPAALAALGAMIAAGTITRTVTGSLTAADRGRMVLASGAITLTLPTVAAAGNGWSVLIDNTGSDTVTLDGASAETVDGAATVALPRGRAAFVVCTGTAWVTVALPGSAGGPVLVTPGAAPGLAFGGDEDTGVGSPGANQLGLMAGSVYRTILSTTALTTTVPLLAPSGTAAAPGIAFSASTGMGLFRHSATVMGVAVGGAGAAYLTSTGRLGLGTAAPAARMHIAGEATDEDSRVLMDRASDDGTGARIQMRKSRGTAGAPTALNSGDRALTILASGHDGTAFFSMAEIAVAADAAFASGSTPGRVIFSTTPAGSTAMAERFRLDEAGGKFTGRIEANGAPFWGRQLVIANNAVATITPPFTGGEFLITVGGGVGATVTDDGACADLHIDCGTTPFIEKLGWTTRGTLVATSYAVLTGTTGGVGFLTVSPQNNGTFLVENRLGASKTVRIWGL